MPQLDGLRALAIVALMLHHFHYGVLDAALPLALGVQLFFVLSGFLITGIPLRGEMTVGDCRMQPYQAPDYFSSSFASA